MDDDLRTEVEAAAQAIVEHVRQTPATHLRELALSYACKGTPASAAQVLSDAKKFEAYLRGEEPSGSFFLDMDTDGIWVVIPVDKRADWRAWQKFAREHLRLERSGDAPEDAPLPEWATSLGTSDFTRIVFERLPNVLAKEGP